jgi:hypothetical protein
MSEAVLFDFSTFCGRQEEEEEERKKKKIA